jgi:hypothetical protein
VAALAVVRDLRTELRLQTPEKTTAFEQDLLAEFVLARSSAGVADATIGQDVATVGQLREWFGRPLWELTPTDLDRYFGTHLRDAAPAIRQHKANAIAIYFEFLQVRHTPEIHAQPASWWSAPWMRSTGPAATWPPGDPDSTLGPGAHAAVRWLAARVGQHRQDRSLAPATTQRAG